MSVAVIAEAVGHKNIATTQRFISQSMIHLLVMLWNLCDGEVKAQVRERVEKSRKTQRLA